jgi:hypothetical protein
MVNIGRRACRIAAHTIAEALGVSLSFTYSYVRRRGGMRLFGGVCDWKSVWRLCPSALARSCSCNTGLILGGSWIAGGVVHPLMFGHAYARHVRIIFVRSLLFVWYAVCLYCIMRLFPAADHLAASLYSLPSNHWKLYTNFKALQKLPFYALISCSRSHPHETSPVLTRSCLLRISHRSEPQLVIHPYDFPESGASAAAQPCQLLKSPIMASHIIALDLCRSTLVLILEVNLLQ